MLITIEAVADPPENGMREVKRYAYRQKEGPNAVNPGDSMPAAWIKAFWGALMIKSPVLPTARRPQNEVTI